MTTRTRPTSVSPLLYITLLSLFLPSLSFAQDVRTWITRDGIKHQGSIMFMSSKSVTIKGPKGMISLPIAKLSEEDLRFIQQRKSQTKKQQKLGPAQSPFPPGMSKKGMPPRVIQKTVSPTTTPPIPKQALPATTAFVPGKWPSTVKTTFSPADIQTVSETKREGYIYRSPHFEFRSPFRLPHRAVRSFSLVFEATYDLAKAMPIGLNPQARGNGYYITELFVNNEDYFAAGGPPGSAGSFFPNTGKILVPLPSLGVTRKSNNILVNRGAVGRTLIHEVTHQVMMRWLPLIPIWMGEGFAEITSALPYEAGYFRLSRMSKAIRLSTGSGPGAGRSFEMVPLQRLMSISPQAWSTAVSQNKGQQNYRSACILTYYFLRLDGQGQGKRLINYITAKQKGVNDSEALNTYLLDGRSYEQLQKGFTRAWREEGLKITFSK
ncbi:MAG: hypothetical protein L3J39_05360 [Verrucomicrobiales bacterium]|nr:hypothetical protein [Verrucomicrobiales bacterium]